MLGTILIVGGAVLVGATIMTVSWVIGAYNTMITATQEVAEQWGNVLTEYQRRADLFMNLAESVKSHKAFEKSTLVEVIKMRNTGFGNTKSKQMKNMKGFDGMLSKLMMVFEQYPKLQSKDLYKDFMDEMRVTENRVNLGRVAYNDIVGDYNIYIKKFPTNFIADMFKFQPEVFFKDSEDTAKGTAGKAPKVAL